MADNNELSPAKFNSVNLEGTKKLIGVLRGKKKSMIRRKNLRCAFF
jgi:hypothetical protein